MKETTKTNDEARSKVQAPTSFESSNTVHGHWQIRAYDPSGNLIAEDEISNLVVNEGLNEQLSATLAGGTQKSWYVGLTDGSPTVDATDTMSSHSGWSEVTAYDEASRPSWTPGTVTSQSVDNSGSKAIFTISSDGTTMGGAFLASDDTVGGTSGVLYSVGAFSGGDVTLPAESTLEVTATFTATAA